MLKRIVYGSFFISIFYFISYFFSSELRALISNGGFWSYLHVLMSSILTLGIFIIVVLFFRYLFVDPEQNQKK
ncbi:pyrimidine-nucleoside phosphorylase [Carnobacterium mobile]|uniref:pyrimidine-nucleoside phosphorylase n=1 Tax=Carnobacterium mobile TaxID=2750 RepID=UPI0018679676|nr:pyrimidine-nucleoside phosphorylase [Carnobacterium mobile]